MIYSSLGISSGKLKKEPYPIGRGSSSASIGYAIHVNVITKPLTRFFRYIPIPAFIGLYVCGHLFKISATIKNLGPQAFPGGRLSILIRYAFGNLFEIMAVDVQSVQGGEESSLDFKGKDRWWVLAQGHAIFLGKLIETSTGNRVTLHDKNANPLQPQPVKFPYTKTPQNAFHIHSIYSLTRGEFYTLIALLLSVLALFMDLILTFA